MWVVWLLLNVSMTSLFGTQTVRDAVKAIPSACTAWEEATTPFMKARDAVKANPSACTACLGSHSHLQKHICFAFLCDKGLMIHIHMIKGGCGFTTWLCMHLLTWMWFDSKVIKLLMSTHFHYSSNYSYSQFLLIIFQVIINTHFHYSWKYSLSWVLTFDYSCPTL